ncbi:hypothetical protein GCM10022221_22770 [Actinocorallia aurea]
MLALALLVPPLTGSGAERPIRALASAVSAAPAPGGAAPEQDRRDTTATEDASAFPGTTRPRSAPRSRSAERLASPPRLRSPSRAEPFVARPAALPRSAHGPRTQALLQVFRC